MARRPRLTIDILTLFPALFEGFVTQSLIGRAVTAGRISITVRDIRAFTDDKHHTADDRPFGGGPGMVLKAEPVARAIEACGRRPRPRVILLSPRGRRFVQSDAPRLARAGRLIMICGHYEAVDERIACMVDEEISIGDFVLTGGEIPAMAVIDATARFVPGVVKEEASVVQDSFYNGRLDHPHYTRPAVWRGMPVPEVLLSGDHAAIAAWRREISITETFLRRPDLFRGKRPDPAEARVIRRARKKKQQHTRKGARI